MIQTGRYKNDWFFYCAFIRRAYECTGSIQYAGYKDDGDVGQQYMGTADGVCGLIAWLIAGRDNVMTLTKVEPRYVLLGGVIGAGITLTVIKSMEQLGPAKAALLIVIAQLIVAYVIELLGLFGVEKEPLEWRKIIGMVIALIGVAIFQWK